MNDYLAPVEAGGSLCFFTLLWRSQLGEESSGKVWTMQFLQAKQLALHFLNTHAHTSTRMTVVMVTGQKNSCGWMAESTHNHQKANRLTGLLILAISQHVCPPFNISPSFVPRSPCFLSSSLSVGVYSLCVWERWKV